MFKSPIEPSPASVSEAIELQQTAFEFRQEVHCREEFETYCQWYYATAEKHRAELAAMQNDICIFNWFWRGRSTK